MRTRNIDKEQLVKKQAIEMLVKEGIEGFGMNRLAAACGISVATLYIYYKDKDDLIKKTGMEIGQQFMATTLKGFDPEMPFRDGLWRQWQNRAMFAVKYPKEVACYEIIMHSTHGELILQQGLKDFKTAMTRFCENAINLNQLIPLSRDAFWSVAYGPLYTLLRFHNEGKSIGGKPFKLSKKTMEESFQLVIKALTP